MLLQIIGLWLGLVVMTANAAYTVKKPDVVGTPPKGIKFVYKKDDPNLSLMAFHFNINKPLSGVEGSQYAADVAVVTDGSFIYNEPNIELKPGDTIYYWVFALVRGEGYLLTDQKYVCCEGVVTQKPTTPKPTTPKATTTKKVTTTTKKPTTTPYHGGPTPPKPNCAVDCPCPERKDDEPKCTEYPCLIFEDDFETLDMTRWEHEITAGGGGNWEFQYYYNNRSNTYTKDGVLHIKPTLTEERFGPNSVTKAGTVLEIWGTEPANLCTGNQWWGCRRETGGVNIINPIQSGRIRTVNTFSFRYGRVEFRAKMPLGDWLWPAIWMLPRYQVYGNWPASGEIDLIESRGNREYFDKDGVNIGVNQFGSTLHFGPYWGENGWKFAHGAYNLPGGETFNDDFHVFRLDWDKDGLTFSVDDNEYLRIDTDEGYWKRGEFAGRLPDESSAWVNGGLDAPFDQEFYLIMNVAVGGTGGGDGYFKDEFRNNKYPKPWKDNSDHAPFDFWQAKNQWYETWPKGEDDDKRAMQVDYIKIWKMTEEQDKQDE